jgi:hypothetical protein
MNDVQLANELRDTLAERVLLYASDQGGYAERDHLEKLANGDQRATSDAVQMLESRGLVENNSMGGEEQVTPPGERVAKKIRLLRVGQWRADDIQRAVLTWLANQDDQNIPGVHDFLDAPEAADFDPVITMQEVRDAVDLLEARAYVKAHRALGGAIRAVITARGRAALGSGEPISQLGTSNQTTYDNRNTVNVHDSQVAAVMAGGHHNVQNVEQTISPALRSELAQHVAELIKQAEELSDDTPGVLQVREDLDEISKELVKPDAKPGVLKGVANKALIAFAGAAATSGGQHVVQGLAHLVKLLEQAF